LPHDTTSSCSSSAGSSPASSSPASSRAHRHNFAMPFRLQCRLQRVAKSVGEGMVGCKEDILLPNGAKRMPIGASATFRPSAQWSPTSARHRTIRLQRRIPSLLPLLEAAMVSQQISLVLHKSAKRLPGQHTGVDSRQSLFGCFFHLIDTEAPIIAPSSNGQYFPWHARG